MPQPPPAPALPLALLGTGHALPGEQVLSTDLDRRLGLSSGSVQSAGGVRKRHFAGPHETAASLGAKAARHALEMAKLSLGDIDCLVAASGTMDQGLPCNAALIHRELGLSPLGVPRLRYQRHLLGVCGCPGHPFLAPRRRTLSTGSDRRLGPRLPGVELAGAGIQCHFR